MKRRQTSVYTVHPSKRWENRILNQLPSFCPHLSVCLGVPHSMVEISLRSIVQSRENFGLPSFYRTACDVFCWFLVDIETYCCNGSEGALFSRSAKLLGWQYYINSQKSLFVPCAKWFFFDGQRSLVMCKIYAITACNCNKYFLAFNLSLGFKILHKTQKFFIAFFFQIK